MDVVEDEAFAQRQVAEREFLGAEPPEDRVEQDRAGDAQVGAPRIEAGHVQPLFEARGSVSRLRSRWSALALTRRLRSSSTRTHAVLGERQRAEAEDRARRADDAVEAARRRAGRGTRPSRRLRCLTSRRSSRVRQRVGLDEPLGQPDDAELEAPAERQVRRALPSVTSTLPPPMSITTAGLTPDVDAVAGGQMDEPGLLGARR